MDFRTQENARIGFRPDGLFASPQEIDSAAKSFFRFVLQSPRYGDVGFRLFALHGNPVGKIDDLLIFA